MDTLPLPPRPDLGHYRKRAKDLVVAASSTDEHAVMERDCSRRSSRRCSTTAPRSRVPATPAHRC